ncbi:hypothetical protein GW750_03070 [bacterium]|nr:hypothetical protein [bacterium]
MSAFLCPRLSDKYELGISIKKDATSHTTKLIHNSCDVFHSCAKKKTLSNTI